MKKMIFCAALFGILALSATAAPPEFSLCKFKDDKPAAFTFTFDDGSRDQLTEGMPLMDKYGFKGSFYFIIARVEQGTRDVEKKDKWMNWEECKAFAAAGHEVGNHSMSHKQLVKLTEDEARKEIDDPISIFKEKLGVDVETFCCPGNGINADVRKLILVNHIAITEGRVSYGGKNFTTEMANKRIDEAIAGGKHTIAMIHGISPEGRAYQPFNSAKIFDDHLAYAKSREKEIWIDTLKTISRYKLLQANSTLKVAEVSPDEYTLSLETKPEFKKLQSPLTCRVKADGRRVSAAQNGKSLAVVEDGQGARFDMDSAAGPVTVKLK